VFYDFREVNKKMFFELGRRENMFYVEVVNFGRKSGRVALTVFSIGGSWKCNKKSPFGDVGLEILKWTEINTFIALNSIQFQIRSHQQKKNHLTAPLVSTKSKLCKSNFNGFIY
jgi:hypothetical protein